MANEVARELLLRRISRTTEPQQLTQNACAEVYRKVFDQICNPKDIRGPIHLIYDPTKHLIPLSLILYSIEFMVGSEPMIFTLEGNKVRIISEGYRDGPCGP